MKLSTPDTYFIGTVFLTEDPVLFRQAQSIAIEPDEDEPLQFGYSPYDEVVLVSPEECWDLRNEEPLADIMEIVRKVRRLGAVTSLYIIYGGTQDDLVKTPACIQGILR